MKQRIVERVTLKGSDILENERNWRAHPKKQIEALREVIDDVGAARTLLAYYSERNGGKLTLIDGHARVREYPDDEWIVDVLDVTDEEADKLLLALDNIGDAAKVKMQKLRELRNSTNAGNALQALVNIVLKDQSRSAFSEKPVDDFSSGGSDSQDKDGSGTQSDRNTVEIDSPVTGVSGAFYFISGNKPHLLYCGDWVDIIKHVTGMVDFLLTDPPYGIEYKSREGSDYIGAARPRSYPQHTVTGDGTPFDPTHLLNVGARTMLLWGANNYSDMLPRSRGWVVWDKIKDGEPQSYSDAEIAWTNQDIPVRKISWMWRGMVRQGGDKRYHPTQKPEGVIDWVINSWWRMTAAGKERNIANIFDPYAGSGTTIVVADENNISTISCEIEPVYIEAIGDRVSKRDMSIEPIAFDDVEWSLFFGSKK